MSNANPYGTPQDGQQPYGTPPAGPSPYGTPPTGGPPYAAPQPPQPGPGPYATPQAGYAHPVSGPNPYAMPQGQPDYGYPHGAQGQPSYGYPHPGSAGQPTPGQLPPGQPVPAGYPAGPGWPTTGPDAPYGYDPYGRPYSNKSKITAGLLQIFLGQFGIGRFYTGHTGVALAQLFTLGGLFVWALVDGIVLLASDSKTDAQGRILRG
ncbi:NINE protein [Streptomyces sp. 796.1]|uniref:TM2 domain-containing protein n=1 Tax=Streptomyces sp. 796.1 TaxID=3163029 RepID=UPI0039C8C594